MELETLSTKDFGHGLHMWNFCLTTSSHPAVMSSHDYPISPALMRTAKLKHCNQFHSHSVLHLQESHRIQKYQPRVHCWLQYMLLGCIIGSKGDGQEFTTYLIHGFTYGFKLPSLSSSVPHQLPVQNHLDSIDPLSLAHPMWTAKWNIVTEYILIQCSTSKCLPASKLNPGYIANSDTCR